MKIDIVVGKLVVGNWVVDDYLLQTLVFPCLLGLKFVVAILLNGLNYMAPFGKHF
jgi:hypothetical protein